MRDGKTQVIQRRSSGATDLAEFFEAHSVKVVAVEGPNAGAEFEIRNGRVTLGRGPGVDVAVADPAMSRQHAAIDHTAEGFRIQDLGSTNGLQIDDEPVQAAELEDGSRFKLGAHVFQLVIEERETSPEVYELS